MIGSGVFFGNNCIKCKYDIEIKINKEEYFICSYYNLFSMNGENENNSENFIYPKIYNKSSVCKYIK